MSGYQHKKGLIRDNAIEALLHDPLFKPEQKLIRKAKSVTGEKINISVRATGRPVVKTALPLAFI